MTQGEIEKLTVKVSNIFSELEVRIMSDIVRRIKGKWFCKCFRRLADQQASAIGNGRGSISVDGSRKRITGVGYRNGQDIF